jgi:hypothetical protein
VDAFRFGKRPKRIKYKKTGAHSVYFMAGSLERSDENVERNRFDVNDNSKPDWIWVSIGPYRLISTRSCDNRQCVVMLSGLERGCSRCQTL